MKTPKQLVKILMKSGFTQIQIAEGTNITQSSVSRIYNGVNPDPKVSIVRALEEMVATLESLPEYDDEDNGEG